MNIQNLGTWARPTLLIIFVVATTACLVHTLDEVRPILKKKLLEREAVHNVYQLSDESRDLLYFCLYLRQRSVKSVCCDNWSCIEYNLNELASRGLTDTTKDICIPKEVYEILVKIRNDKPDRLPELRKFIECSGEKLTSDYRRAEIALRRGIRSGY